MKAHRRQFVLGPRPVEFVQGWRVHHILGTGYLSHCPELSITITTDRTGAVWHLLGLALQTDANQPDPPDQIATTDGRSINKLYDTWAGRWLLIGNGQLHLDGAGLLGCFYYIDEMCKGENEVWVSSSAALLNEMFHPSKSGTRVLNHGIGIDWYPPPLSRYTSVCRLLPSQILELKDGRLLPRQLFQNINAHLSYTQLLEKLQHYLVTALRQAFKFSPQLWLPLTAGFDSRLLLAAAHYAGVPVTTYTHTNRFINDADLKLPPLLAQAVNVKHLIIDGDQFDEKLAIIHDLHTGQHHVGQDRDYLARNQFRWSRKGNLILRGGCFEIGRCYYWKQFPGSGVVVPPPQVDEIIKGFREHPDPTLIRALNEWTSWTEQTPHPEMDWRDRFYLEQRLSGWLSSIEQALDLIDAARFVAANSQFYFAHVLQIPEQERRRSQHHRDLIKKMAPALSEFPVNKLPTPFHKKFMRRLSRLFP